MTASALERRAVSTLVQTRFSDTRSTLPFILPSAVVVATGRSICRRLRSLGADGLHIECESRHAAFAHRTADQRCLATLQVSNLHPRRKLLCTLALDRDATLSFPVDDVALAVSRLRQRHCTSQPCVSRAIRALCFAFSTLGFARLRCSWCSVQSTSHILCIVNFIALTIRCDHDLPIQSTRPSRCGGFARLLLPAHRPIEDHRLSPRTHGSPLAKASHTRWARVLQSYRLQALPDVGTCARCHVVTVSQ